MRGVYLVWPTVVAVVFIRLTMIYPKRIHHKLSRSQEVRYLSRPFRAFAGCRVAGGCSSCQ